MPYKIFITLFFLFSCVTYDEQPKIISTSYDSSFSNTGFALIYDQNTNVKNKFRLKFDERSLVVYQRNLKKNTYVKITNLSNNKSVIAQVGKKIKYPKFYNSLISKRISEEIDLNIDEPYIEIKEIDHNSTFVANKAKTFDEEKNVANKAPVDDISIKSIGLDVEKTENIKSKKTFMFIIKVADFYFIESAKSLKNRIFNELDLKNVHIKTLSKTKYRVYSGPYKNLISLEEAFYKIDKLEFENIEIVKL